MIPKPDGSWRKSSIFRRGQIVLDSSNNNPADAGVLLSARAVALIAKASEGASFSDPTIEGQRQAAQKCRVPFGAYLFFHASADPATEVSRFLADARLRAGDLQPIVDAEVSDGEAMSSVAFKVDAVVTQLERRGYRPILYMPVWMFLQVLGFRPSLAKRVVIWEPQYPGRFARWFPSLAKSRIRVGHGVTVVMWQFTDCFAVGSRRFDASVLLCSLDKLRIGVAARG